MDNQNYNSLLQQLMMQNKSLPYQTNLNPIQQMQFAKWAAENNIPVDLSKKSDYDMPGFFKANQAGNPDATSGISNVDNKLHFTDKFKTPLHETVSNESQYAPEGAPHWEGNSQYTPEGNLSAMELPGGDLLKIKALQKLLKK